MPKHFVAHLHFSKRSTQRKKMQKSHQANAQTTDEKGSR